MNQFPLRCEGCDRFFGHIRSYDLHAAGNGCGSDTALRDRGLIQDADGVWWTSVR